MKKAGIFLFSMIMILAMFSGCRRQTPDTTVNSSGSQTTTKATTPSTTKAPTAAPSSAPSGTGVIPNPTDMLPSGTDATSGSGMSRGHRGPRY